METKTETNTEARAELARLSEVERLITKPVEWTAERVDLLRKQVAPPQASPEEFALFLDWCKATGLNPFVQQAYLVPRRVKIGEQWAEKCQPQASIGGMRALVDLQPDFLGFVGGAVWAGDKFAVDQTTGRVVHEWDLDARQKAGWRVLGGWGHAKRKGRETRLVFLTLDSRIQRTREGKATQFWERDPAGMITKCAEAAALREAYPNALSGVFVAEEATHEVEVNTTPEPPAGTKTDALRARLVAPPSDKPSPTTAKKPTPPPYPPADVVRWGEHKGKAIAECTDAELAATLATKESTLAKIAPKSAAADGRLWGDVLIEGARAIEAEIALRRAGGEVRPTEPDGTHEGGLSREPGSEG